MTAVTPVHWHCNLEINQMHTFNYIYLQNVKKRGKIWSSSNYENDVKPVKNVKPNAEERNTKQKESGKGWIKRSATFTRDNAKSVNAKSENWKSERGKRKNCVRKSSKIERRNCGRKEVLLQQWRHPILRGSMYAKCYGMRWQRGRKGGFIYDLEQDCSDSSALAIELAVMILTKFVRNILVSAPEVLNMNFMFERKNSFSWILKKTEND